MLAYIIFDMSRLALHGLCPPFPNACANLNVTTLHLMHGESCSCVGSLLLLSLPLSRGNPGNSQCCSPPPARSHANHRLSKKARQAEHMMLEHPCTAPLAALLYRHFAEALNMTFTPSAVPCRGIRRKLLCVHAQGPNLCRNHLGGSAPHEACQ